MNVYDVLKNQESNVSITIKREDLMMFGQYLIAETKKEFETFLEARNTEEYLTKNEVSDILHVSLVTLWKWDKSNYLKPIEVGGRRLYKKSEISKLLKK